MFIYSFFRMDSDDNHVNVDCFKYLSFSFLVISINAQLAVQYHVIHQFISHWNSEPSSNIFPYQPQLHTKQENGKNDQSVWLSNAAVHSNGNGNSVLTETEHIAICNATAYINYYKIIRHQPSPDAFSYYIYLFRFKLTFVSRVLGLVIILSVFLLQCWFRVHSFGPSNSANEINNILKQCSVRWYSVAACMHSTLSVNSF